MAYQEQFGEDQSFKLMKPVHVKSVKVKLTNNDKYIYVNICKSDLVDCPMTTGNGNWKFPQRFSPSRSFEGDIVHDVTFHTEAFELKGMQFELAILDSSLESLQNYFKYEFNKNCNTLNYIL